MSLIFRTVTLTSLYYFFLFQDLTNANHNAESGKPGQNILPEKRGARHDVYIPTRQSSYQHQQFVIEQRDPANANARQGNRMVRTVTDPAQSSSNASSYQFGPADNIDERDAEDPLCVTDYVQDMYQHFRGKEVTTSVRPLYMENQPHINERMRSILVDWLVEVHLKFKLVPETLYLTTNLIDRYLERQEVSRPKLQLVGVTSLLIASKYEEIYPPELRDLVYICDRAYTRSEVRLTSFCPFNMHTKVQRTHRPLPFTSDHFNGRKNLEKLRVQYYHPKCPCLLGPIPESRTRRQAHCPALMLHFGWNTSKLQPASLPSKSACCSRSIHCSSNGGAQFLESYSPEICQLS